MNYTFVQIKPSGSYLTIVDASNNPRYLCFQKPFDALSCIGYISKFRSRHGFFPLIDLSRPDEKFEIRAKENRPLSKREPSQISKFFKIQTISHLELDKICSMNNINLLYVDEFSYMYTPESDIKLLLTAQELNSNPNPYRYKKKLNDLYYK